MIPLKQYIKDYPIFFWICFAAVVIGIGEEIILAIKPFFPSSGEGYFAAGFFSLLYIIVWAIDSAKVKE